MKENAYSLIELLITVSIIVILISISLPKFNEYLSKSNDSLAKADARNSISTLTNNKKR